MRYFLPVLAVLILGSCRKEEKVIRNKVQAFFNLEDFAKEEAGRNSASVARIEKTILMNGKEEKTSTDSISWEKELRPLEINDINKVSWVDKFEADTLSVSTGTKYRYVTADPEIPVKNLVVDIDSTGKIWRIHLETVQNNPLIRSRQIINYFPGKGYTLQGKQKARFLRENTFYIQAVFTEK